MINSLFSSPHWAGAGSVFRLTSPCSLGRPGRGPAPCDRAVKRSGAAAIHAPRQARSSFHGSFSFSCCGERICLQQSSGRLLGGCKYQQDPSLSKRASENVLRMWEKCPQQLRCVWGSEVKAWQPCSWQPELAAVEGCHPLLALCPAGLKSPLPAPVCPQQSQRVQCAAAPLLWLRQHRWRQPRPLTVHVSTLGSPSLPARSAVPSGSPSASLLPQQVLDPSRSCRYSNEDPQPQSSSFSSSNWVSASRSARRQTSPNFIRPSVHYQMGFKCTVN